MGGVPAILGVTAECHMSQLKAHTLKLLFPPLEDFFLVLMNFFIMRAIHDY